jgi:Cellulose binding domain
MKRARLLGALLLLPLAFLVLPATAAYAAGGTATFTQTSTWDGGYQGQYTITNTGTTAVSGWTVEFDLPSGTTAGTYWDATLTQTESHYAFKNRDYNGSIAPGASTSFGFVVSGTGTPTGCTLNGVSCTGDGGGSDTQPPSVPGGFTVTGHTSSSVSLSVDRLHRQRRRDRLRGVPGIVPGHDGDRNERDGVGAERLDRVHLHGAGQGRGRQRVGVQLLGERDHRRLGRRPTAPAVTRRGAARSR